MGFYIIDQAIVDQQTATTGLGNELSLEIQQRTEAVTAVTTALTTTATELRNSIATTAATAEAHLDDAKTQINATVVTLQAADASQVASIEALGAVVANNKSAIEATVTALDTDLHGKLGSLAGLNTTSKGNVVAAINEVSATVATDKATVLASLATEQARSISVTGVLSSLATTDKTTLVGAINELRTGYLSSDASINASILSLQNAISSNTTVRGSISAITELAALTEAGLKQGYMWSHKVDNDLYMYIPESANGFDYKPEGWTGGFVIFGNISDITGAVSTLNTSVVASVARLDSRIDTVVTTLESADVQINSRLAVIEGTGQGSIAKAKSDLTDALAGVSASLTTAIQSNATAIATASADLNTKIGDISGLTSPVKTSVVAGINSVSSAVTTRIDSEVATLSAGITQNSNSINAVDTDLQAVKADIIVRDFKVIRGRPLSPVAFAALDGKLLANALGEFTLTSVPIKGSGDLVQISFVTNNETDENGNVRFSIVSGYYASQVAGSKMKVLVDTFPEDFVGTQVVVDWYYEGVTN